MVPASSKASKSKQAMISKHKAARESKRRQEQAKGGMVAVGACLVPASSKSK